MVGDPYQTVNCLVESVGSASNRMLGTDTVNRKDHIFSDLIHQSFSRANLNNTEDIRNVICMFCVSLAFSDWIISIS